MKKSIFSYFSYLVLLLLAVGTLSSCDTTETVDAAPSITVNPETAEVEVGQTTTFTYQVVSTDNRLTEVRIIYPEKADEVITDFADKNLYSGEYNFTGQTADAGNSVTFNIEARDRDGNVSRKEITVKVVASTEPISVSTSVAVILAAQGVSSQGSFVDVDGTTATVYNLANAKANAASIDFAYLQGGDTAGQGGVIGSPKDESVEAVYGASLSAANGVHTWNPRNDTRFKETNLNEVAFNALDGAGVIAAYNNGTKPDNTGAVENSSSRVNKLAVGKVFAFKTAQGKEGVAYVKSLTAGETGSITLDIKVVR